MTISDSNSILNSTKKALGITADYDAFDLDITMHINTVLSTLGQLGIGAINADLSITDTSDSWDDVFGAQSNIGMLKSYIYLRVRLLFDPPATGFTLASFERQISEFEWRISVIMSNLR